MVGIFLKKQEERNAYIAAICAGSATWLIKYIISGSSYIKYIYLHYIISIYTYD